MRSIEFFTPDSLVTVLSAETFKISKFLDIFSDFLSFFDILNLKKIQKVDFFEPSGAQTRNGLALIKTNYKK